MTNLCKRLVSAQPHSDSSIECQMYTACLTVGADSLGTQLGSRRVKQTHHKAAQQLCRDEILHIRETHPAAQEAGQQESPDAHNAVAKHNQALLGAVRMGVEYFPVCVDSTALGGFVS